MRTTTTQAIDTIDDDLGPALFLQAHEGRGDRHLVRRDLRQAVSRDVLPARAVLQRTVDAGRSVDLLAELDETVVLLRSWPAGADLWITAPSEAAGRRIADEVVGRVPARTPGVRVETHFVAAAGQTRYVDLLTRPWSEVRHVYPTDVSDALELLVGHRHDPAEPRQLLLWHGAPGTGKTTAIRALMHAWQEWAVPVVVGDPESLLTDPRYLRRVVLDTDEEKWRLVVLEDAEALLHKGSGKGLAQLLNLCDGLLGQGLQCLFLITTNEPLAAVHPALVRPGRCLARVEFGPMPAEQAARVLGRRVDRAMTLAEVTAAGPLSVRRPEASVGQYL